MLERGKIIKAEKGLATVEFLFAATCQKCGECRTASDNRCQLEVINQTTAGVGSWVEVALTPGAKLFSPLLVFGLPILFFLVGLIVGSFFSEPAGIILAGLFLLGSFFLVRFIDRMLNAKLGLRGEIVRLIE